MKYLDVTKILGNRDTKKASGVNTYFERRENGAVALRYHETDVITWNGDGTATLDSGGWESATTKSRMNNFGPAGIFQVSRVWYLSPSGEEYYDGVTVSEETGEIIPAEIAA